ncbi:hypothetical protein SODALDRAFT_331180 [Sodiomyces alkalinus F11]|uniref:Acyl-CoA dehydrogenase n=1 Tax=Sodiomyces alkalinus (strain CBS 110278 / VKM F-3762 / F11) TaxID=1314773 RepID=A0A3N2Q3V3_SODAK|nr:hypothetical protein SODALDRAFT_331180 [Sodiomyces alkalinus F11]ROT41451.1 hypothetical protein SODALDRAFT_331180 [Sodiomyces alkalinus F11]
MFVSHHSPPTVFLPPDIRTAVEPELAQLGEDVLSDQIFAWITDAERNKPYLRGAGRDAFGRPRSHLVVGEGWRRLQEFGLCNGFVAAGYDHGAVSAYGPFARVVQFFRLHLWTASAANVTCPSAMQDGAARLLQLHLARSDLDPTRRMVFENAFRHLTSRDPATAWTSGQWMTERTGGSDVSLTETLARYRPSSADPNNPPGLASAEEGIPLGPWSVSGFKWFSSATDSAMTILLARTPRGITAFFAPMRRHDPSARSELNGVRIQRLKHKFGTQSLPTAELELDGMRAWLVGEDGRGVNEIATVLTLTRIHSAVAALGYLGRGLGVARAYAKVRVVGAGRGRRLPLTESPLHMRTLAAMTADYHGLLLLTFFTSYVLGLDEHPASKQTHGGGSIPSVLAALTPDTASVAPLLRVLTPLCKAYVCKNSVPLLYACMESLGGLGYMLNEETEYLNVARLFRDCGVLAIWEGTTDVLSTDFVRALKHPRGGRECLDALDRLITTGWPKDAAEMERGDQSSSWCPLTSWQATRALLEAHSQDELIGDARQILWSVAEAIIAVLLYSDVRRDGGEAARDILDRFVAQRSRHAGSSPQAQGYTATLQRDKAIVYGGAVAGTSRL